MATKCDTRAYSFTLTDSQGAAVLSNNLYMSGMSTTLGYGSTPSKLELELVPDPCVGIQATVTSVGTPVYFSTSAGFTFNGILSSATESLGSNGLKYKISINDPRKVLESTSVLIKDYYCPIYNVPNLINVCHLISSGSSPSNGAARCPVADGYSETSYYPAVDNCSNFNFNAENGVSLLKILLAIQAYPNVVLFTSNGSRLRVNLSSIINRMASNYWYSESKTNSQSSSLFQLITEACEAIGCEFYVFLQNDTIGIGLIDRTMPPSNNAVRNIVLQARNDGTCINSDLGYEENYSVANKLVLGEKIQYLSKVETERSAGMFLGYDESGFPIIANGSNFTVNIDTSAIGDIIGGFPRSFPISEEEILCSGSTALWRIYGSQNPNSFSAKVMNSLGLNSVGSTIRNSLQKLLSATTDDEFKTILTGLTSTDAPVSSIQSDIVKYDQIWSWFNRYISTWYGKRWLVPINKICASFNPANIPNGILSDGGSAFLSDSPTDSGWATPGNAIGLIDYSLFLTSDGKMSGFGGFLGNKSISRTISGNRINFIVSPEALDTENYIYQPSNNVVYAELQSDGGKVFFDGSTFYAIISTPFIGMIPEFNPDFKTPGLRALACFLNSSQRQSLINLQNSSGGYAGKSHLNIFRLRNAACGFAIMNIPMKSNIYSYGPWFSSKGNVGATVFESTNLSPWAYGGLSSMNFVGQALAYNGLRDPSATESGSVTLAEPPRFNLGLMDGSVISSVTTNFNESGVTTTYSFISYSTKFGQYARALAEEVQRSTAARNQIVDFAVSQRRQGLALAASTRGELARQYREKTGASSSFTSLQSSSPLEQKCPAFIISGGYYSNGPNTGSRTYEVGINSVEQIETSASSSNFRNIAMMSLDGILSPVSLFGRNNSMPGFALYIETNETKHKSRPSMPPVKNQKFLPINSQYLNPITNKKLIGNWDGRGTSDSFTILMVSFGDDVGSVTSMLPGRYDSASDFSFYALRGPLVLQSWGYDTENKPIPNIVDTIADAEMGTFKRDNTQNKFMNNWLSNPGAWPVGPIDLRFDRDRGVWVCPPPDRIVLAELTQDLKASGQAEAKLIDPKSTFYNKYKVFDQDGTSILSPTESKIDVYDFLGKSAKAGTKIYALYNDDKYIILEKGQEDELPEYLMLTTKSVGDISTNDLIVLMKAGYREILGSSSCDLTIEELNKLYFDGTIEIRNYMNCRTGGIISIVNAHKLCCYTKKVDGKEKKITTYNIISVGHLLDNESICKEYTPPATKP